MLLFDFCQTSSSLCAQEDVLSCLHRPMKEQEQGYLPERASPRFQSERRALCILYTWEDAHTKQECPRAYSRRTDVSEGSATVLHFETRISVYIRVSQLSLAPRGYACNSVWTQEILCNESDKTPEKTAHRAWKSPSLQLLDPNGTDQKNLF